MSTDPRRGTNLASFYLNGTLCTGGLIRLTENTNLPHRLSETYRLTLLVSVDKAKSADSTGQYKK